MDPIRWLWFDNRFLWALGYLWASPMVIAGYLLLALAKLAGAVESARFLGPACLVRIRGPFAERMHGKWRAHTVGACMFCYTEPAPETVIHETVHVKQQMVLGVFHVVVYGVSWVLGLIRYGNAMQAYWDCVLERHARRAAGEE